MATNATIDREDPAQLEAGRNLVVQYLNEAHATEKALVTTLQAHIAMTPQGAYRDLLERHLTETRQHTRAIERRLGELGSGASLVSATVGLVQTLVGQLLAFSKGPVDVLRGAGGEEKLLKNAKDECATEALEIATYDALETLAEAVGDAKTARLAALHRGEEERMLDDLRGTIPSLTDATVLTRVGGRPTYDASRTGAAGNVRSLRERGVERPRADDLPIPGYEALDAGQVAARLNDLTQRQLQAVAAYERRHRKRRSVLERIDALVAEEPWDGYDEQAPEEVLRRIRGADEATLGRLRDYEGRHRRRVAVLEAAHTELSRS